MKAERRNILLEELQNELGLLARSLRVLETSYHRCKGMSSSADLSEDDYIGLEALTARFSRTSDLLTQKIFRIIDTLELQEEGSLIDRINRAEKRGLTESGNSLSEIRDLRNQIAHEYSARDLARIFGDVLKLAPLLIQTARAVIAYCRRFTSLPS